MKGVHLSSKQHLVKRNPPSHAHLIRSVGPYIMHIEDMLWSFDRDIGFWAIYNERETEYRLRTKFKFYAHAQQLKNEED